jgi:hypothetical protein
MRKNTKFATVLLSTLLNFPILQLQAQDSRNSPVQKPKVVLAEGQDLPKTATAPNSFVDNFLRNIRRGMGFSVGISEAYVPEFIVTQEGTQSTTFTTLTPRVFFGIENTRSAFRMDYSFGYQQYSRENIPRSSTHSAFLTYRYRVSSRVNFNVNNEFRSAVNDLGLTLGSSLGSAPSGLNSNFDQLLYVPRRRISSDVVGAGVDVRASKRLNLGVFASYSFWRYHEAVPGTTNAGQIGIQAGYQLNKWLVFNNSFSQYLNDVGNNAANIQRLQAGGLSFRSVGNVEFSFGGGLESATTLGRRETTGSGSVTLTKTSASTALSLAYHRGFSPVVGVTTTGSVLAGNNVSASVTQWLHKRMNLKLTALYTSGRSFDTAKLEAVSGEASFEVAFGNNVLLSGQYYYLSQKNAGLSTLAPTISRPSASIGLQYFVSSLKAGR